MAAASIVRSSSLKSVPVLTAFSPEAKVLPRPPHKKPLCVHNVSDLCLWTLK